MFSLNMKEDSEMLTNSVVNQKLFYNCREYQNGFFESR
jgi:hypothetical protein